MDSTLIVETAVIALGVSAGIKPVTESALAIADRVAKARAAGGRALADILRDLPLPAPSTPPRPSITQYSAGAADEGPAPAVPALAVRSEHAIERHGYAWTCRCGAVLAPRRQAAREAMRAHRADVARAGLNGAA